MTLLYLVSGGLVAIAAGGIAIGQILRWARTLARTLDKLNRVINTELDPDNHSTVKEDLHAMAIALGNLQRQVNALAKVVAKWR